MTEKSVTVFGGSWPPPGSEPYRQARRLGKLIASRGWTVLTGGYIGTMEAVSRGAAEAGGHVIGVTCDEIEDWRKVGKNPWVKEERRYQTVRERLFALIDDCDAALALPGGIGTLNEIAFMWSQVQTRSIAERPLILIGPGWQRTFDLFHEVLHNYVPADHRSLLSYVPDVESAVSTVQTALDGLDQHTRH